MGVFRVLPNSSTLQTDDGDASFESFAQGVPRDFSLQDPTGIVPSDGVISKIMIGWKAKDPNGNGDLMRAGILSGGVRQFGLQQSLDAATYLGPFEDEFTLDASDGLPWTFAKLAVASFTAIADQVNGADDRITFAYADVHATSPPGAHVSAAPQSNAPGGAPQSSAPGAAPAAQAPGGAAT